MPGQMRKIMAYLGLVDDDYDDFDDLADRRPTPSRPSRPQRDRYEDDDRYDRYDRQDRYDRRERRPEPRQEPAGFGTVSRIHPMTPDGRPVDARDPRQPASRPAVQPMAPAAKLPVVEPRSFADAKMIGDYIKQSSAVVLNLQQADRELQRRMLDFTSGMAYVLGCGMRRVVDGVFVITPANVALSDEDIARLGERDYSGR